MLIISFVNFINMLPTGDTGRRLRHPKRFMAIPSPITAVEWWRVRVPVKFSYLDL